MDDTIETSTKTAEPPQPSASETIESMSAVARDGVTKARDQILSRSAGVRDQLALAATSAKEQIDAMAEPLKQKAHSIADDHKIAGTQQFGALARAINLAADELQDELPQASGYVREAAAKVDNVSTMIRERNIEDLIHEANHFARSNAVAFFGISVVAGFALARFLKSGAPSHSEHGLAPHRPQAQPHPASEAASVPPERFAAISSSKF